MNLFQNKRIKTGSLFELSNESHKKLLQSNTLKINIKIIDKALVKGPLSVNNKLSIHLYIL